MDLKQVSSQCSIVASPVGTIYLINTTGKALLWPYEIPRYYPDRRTYEAMQKVRVTIYMDAHVDKYGGINLYLHNTSKNPKAIPIPLTSGDEVRKRITSYFGDRVTTIINVIRVNLDHKQGKRVKRPQGIVCIEKTEYEIIHSDWHLRFSKYQANVISNENCPSLITVYHTHDVEAFSGLCCTTMGVVDESINYDIWRIQNMTLQTWPLVRNSTYPTHDNVFRMGGLDVIVKSVPKTLLIPSTVRTFWSSNNDKFLIFHGVKSDEKNYHFIFEHCKYTLYEYLLKTGVATRRLLMRDLVDGIMFLHGQNLCLTKLNPWNVWITKNRTLKISGFSLEPSTKKLVDEELRALGKLIAFFYSNLINPNKHFTVEDYDAKKKIEFSQFTSAHEARDIADQLQYNKRPPSLNEVSLHPFLWGSDKRIQFCSEACAFLELNTDSTKKYRTEMIFQKHSFGFLDWKSRVPLELFEQQEKMSIYNTSHPWHLLRFIRNIYAHHPAVSEGAHLKAREWLGSDNSVTESSFQSKFPYFITGLYSFLKERAPHEEFLRRYYEMDT